MFLEVAGRAASSADNAQATSFFMINDEGVWLIERPRGREAVELFTRDPAALGGPHRGRLALVRQRGQAQGLRRALRVPATQWPYYLGWNGQHSNAPGTTCFLPVVDNTRQYINVLLILLSEPHGKVPLFIDDWQPFRPSNAMEWAAWAASKVGLVDPIPYQPIGGLKRARGGFASLGRAGAAGLDHDRAHRLRGALPDPEPDAHRRGAAPRRLGPRRADDPARLAARPGQGHPRPRLPRVQRQDRSTRAGSAGRRCRPRSPTTSASTACSRACARRTSPTWTRPSTRCSRRSSAPGGTYADAEVFAPGLQGQGDAPRPT